MAIIHSYPGGEPESGDKLIVTDAAGRKTKSVSVDSLVSYVNDANQEAAPVYTPITDELIATGIVSQYYNDKEAPGFASPTNTPYYGSIENWDVSQVTNMDSMFSSKTIEFDLSLWNTGNVTSMRNTFAGAAFISDFMLGLSTWDMSSVTTTSGMFTSSNFNGNISDWDTSKVTSMANMFYDASSFNQDLNSWDVSSVTNMYRMFAEATFFNQDLNSWDVYRVISTQQMFSGATSFNGNISSWDTGKVASMFGMFSRAEAFNKSINSWDVSKVVNMGSMFEDAESFNQLISGWDVSSVTNMDEMFFGATDFSRDISSLNVPNIETRPDDFYDGYIGGDSSYEPEWGINKLEGHPRAEGFEIADIQNPKDLVTKEFVEGAIDTAINPPAVYTPLTNATLRTAVSSYNAGNLLPEFNDPNNVPYYGLIEDWDVSQVTATGDIFSNIALDGFDLSKWDVSNVTDMSSMFSNSTGTPDISAWDVSNVKQMTQMFSNSEFAGDLSTWDVGKVQNTLYMFEDCPNLENLDLSGWDVSRVINMQGMFQGSNFDGVLDDWDVSGVVNMRAMFKDNYDFNQYLNNWDVSNVVNMNQMFAGSSFNGAITAWDVSKVVVMDEMFASDHFFIGDISKWDVSNVTSMNKMLFDTQSFNGIDLSGWDVAHIPSEPTDFKTLSVFGLPEYQPQWGVKLLDGTVVKASGVEIANITDPKHLVTKEFVEENVGGSGYSHTGAFADKPSTNDRVWEAGQGINYTQSDANAGLWKVFSINRAVHLEVDNPYWTDPAPDTITNGVFTNTNTGKGLFQGKHLPQGVSSLVDYTYSYDVEHFNNLNMFGYSSNLQGFNKLNGVTTFINQTGEGGSTAAAKLIFNNNVGSVQDSITVHPGQTYFVSWYAKLDTGSSSFNPAYAISNKSDGNSAVVSSTAYGHLLDDALYSLIGVEFTAPSNCYEVSVKIATANNNSGTIFIDKPQMNDGTARGAYTLTSGGAATTPKITHNYYEYPNSKTGYEGSTGRIKLNDIKVGDQLRVRFDFNVTPQIPNTTVEPALWYSNRTVNDQITYSFPLTTQPIFYGSGTVGNTFLNRPEISAWITSEEDINALALPAIKSDNPVIIQPLGLLITIIR